MSVSTTTSPELGTEPGAGAGGTFSTEDWRLIQQAPFSVYMAIAGADGSIDEDETAAFGEIVARIAGETETSPLTRRVMASISCDVGVAFEHWRQQGRPSAQCLREVAAALERGAAPGEGPAFKEALRRVAAAIAGVRVGRKDEQAAITVINAALDVATKSPAPPPAGGARDSPVLPAPETKECPRCGEEIKARAQVCRFCGAELETARTGYCAACHQVVSVDERNLCARCGAGTIDPHLETHAAAVTSNVTAAPAPTPAAGLIQFASGLGDLSIAPPEIRRWNWGAFLLSFVWGVSNRVYSSVLTLIPFFGFVVPFVLGAKGNEWAWANKRWESVEHFQGAQKRWAIAGLAVWLVVICISVIAYATR